jgi:hypothetical protein
MRRRADPHLLAGGRERQDRRLSYAREIMIANVLTGLTLTPPDGGSAGWRIKTTRLTRLYVERS